MARPLGAVARSVVPGQLTFEIFRGPCPHTSNGQGCRYYADHDPVPHTYGGGLGDPVSNRHCGKSQPHISHAWTDEKAWFNCSGCGLGLGLIQ